MEQAVGKALSYLASQQTDSGGFISYSSASLTPFSAEYEYRTTFVPALILSAISGCDDDMAIAMRAKLAAYLLRQRSERWSFNYWDRSSSEAAHMPYPDDLDDTFCALSALWLHDASIIDKTALAHAVRLLLATESKVGGPYRTWLVDKNAPDSWQDVDIVVNANVAYFLRLSADVLPNLSALMGGVVKRKDFSSPYYPDVYPAIYFLSRAYDGRYKRELAAYVYSLQQPDGSWGSVLHTALALSSLLHLGMEVPGRAMRWLREAQHADGSWSADAFCIDPSRDGKRFYHGSDALTTAFALEVMILHHKRSTITPEAADFEGHQDKRMHPFVQTIEERAAQLCSVFDAPNEQRALHALRYVVAGKNGEEVALLPKYFWQGLNQSFPEDEVMFERLALANVCGWTAYTIYDDFIDNEGNAKLLAQANVAMRNSYRLFRDVSPAASWYELVDDTFNRMDAANAWELEHCRWVVRGKWLHIGVLPDYGELERLAERSEGHALPALGILTMGGILPDEASAQAVRNAIHHYLIARQLNDDIHDWQEDLLAGRITFVVAELLRSLHMKPGPQKTARFMSYAEQQFWRNVLPEMCAHISSHTSQSRAFLSKSGILMPGNVIEGLLDKLDDLVLTTKASIAEADAFLEAYKAETSLPGILKQHMTHELP